MAYILIMESTTTSLNPNRELAMTDLQNLDRFATEPAWIIDTAQRRAGWRKFSSSEAAQKSLFRAIAKAHKNGEWTGDRFYLSDDRHPTPYTIHDII